jgi:hypothetical protein
MLFSQLEIGMLALIHIGHYRSVLDETTRGHGRHEGDRNFARAAHLSSNPSLAYTRLDPYLHRLH